MRIAVTGGAGFIGSHTVVALANAGHHPIVIDDFRNSNPFIIGRLETLCKGKISFHEADCNDPDKMAGIFEKEQPEGIIHFAAYKAVGESVRKPLMYYRNNVGSLLTVLELQRQFGIPYFVFSSSCTVYGVPDALPVTESSPVKKAQSPYGFTKQVGEQILFDLQKAAFQFSNSVILRYFNPIGAHPSGLIGELPLGEPENLVPYITQTAAGIRQVLTIFGKDYDTADGTAIRDYIHVMDLAEAHVKALEYLARVSDKKGMTEVFNLGMGHGSSVKEVVETFEDVSAVKLNYQYGPRRPGDVPAIYANADKARQKLGWQCRRSLRDALRDAWQWQKQLGDMPV
jgi:UDP-glucose 4-epimerase